MQHIDKKPIRVFLVNDHKTLLWGLERLIESVAPRMRIAGTAESGEELLSKLPANPCDVILLDLDIAGVNSLTYLEKIGPLTTARVLIFTGSNDTAVHHQAVIRGARGVVHKRVSVELLLNAIDKVHHGEIWLDQATLGRVMDTLSNGGKPDAETDKMANLTTKERQIVTAIAKEKGAPNKMIAAKLHMSEHTLRNHLTTIYDKLELKGRMELYLYASSRQRGARRATDKQH